MSIASTDLILHSAASVPTDDTSPSAPSTAAAAEPVPEHHPSTIAAFAHGALAALVGVAHLLGNPAVLEFMPAEYRRYAVVIAAAADEVQGAAQSSSE
jgi:hypothetical protein